jgi:hypothetical protein
MNQALYAHMNNKRKMKKIKNKKIKMCNSDILQAEKLQGKDMSGVDLKTYLATKLNYCYHYDYYC